MPKLEVTLEEQLDSFTKNGGQVKTELQKQEGASKEHHRTIDHHLYKIKQIPEEVLTGGRVMKYHNKTLCIFEDNEKDISWNNEKGHWEHIDEGGLVDPAGACECGSLAKKGKNHPCFLYDDKKWMYVHGLRLRLMKRYRQDIFFYQPALHGMPCSNCGVVLDPYWDNRKYREKYVSLESRFLKKMGVIDRVSRL